jgi:hypothetical protein
MAILPKAINLSNAIPIKTPMTFFTEIEKSILKFIWKYKRLNSQSNSEKKSNAGAITRPDLKLCCRAILIKTVWYWHKNQYEDQWNRLEDPDINPCSYSHLIFDKGAQNICWEKDSPSIMVLGKLECRMKLDACLSSYTNINLK